MKKFKSLLIAISSLALSVGAAVGVGLGAEKAQEAKANGESHTIYCAIDSSTLGTRTLKANLKLGDNDWINEAMTLLGFDVGYNKLVYSYTFSDKYGGVNTFQYQLWTNGSGNPDVTDQFYDGWKTSGYDDCLHVFQGGNDTFTAYNPKTITRYGVYDGVLDNVNPLPTRYINSGTSYNPTKGVYQEGYTFDGWFTDSDCAVGHAYSEQSITDNIVLYAKYTPTAERWSGTIHVDLRDSDWHTSGANYAVMFMDKTTYESEIVTWSNYVTGTATGVRLVNITYNIGFNPQTMLVVRYNSSNTQQTWNSDKWEGKWDQSVDFAFAEMVRIGDTKTAGNNNVYSGYPKIVFFDGVTPDKFLDKVKVNGSNHAEYYSDLVTLTEGQTFKIQVAPYAQGDYYGNYSTPSEMSSKFGGGNGNNIEVNEDGIYAFYFDSVTNNVHITDPVSAAADDWAQDFLDLEGTNNCTYSKTNWATLKTSFDANVTLYSNTYLNLFKLADHHDHSEVVSGYITLAIQRYDYVLELYGVANDNDEAHGFQDFMQRVDAHKVTPKHNTNPVAIIDDLNSNSALVIIIASSVVTLLAIGGYFYLRKRKEDR